MTELPDSLLDGSFDEQIRQGTVVYYVGYQFDTEIKNKFLILLNRDCSQSEIYYFLTTSQTKFYKSTRRFKEYFVFVPENTVSFFSRPTLIDCRHPELVSRNKLREKYGNRELRFKGMLPEPFMTKVVNIVKASSLIAERTKELIFGIE